MIALDLDSGTTGTAEKPKRNHARALERAAPDMSIQIVHINHRQGSG